MDTFSFLFFFFPSFLQTNQVLASTTTLLSCEVTMKSAWFSGSFKTLSYSSWTKTLHFNIAVAMVPVLVAVLRDRGKRTLLYYVLVHPLRHEVHQIRRGSSATTVISMLSMREIDGGSGGGDDGKIVLEMREMPVAGETSGEKTGETTGETTGEKSSTTTASTSITMETYDVDRGVRMLTLVGLPVPNAVCWN